MDPSENVWEENRRLRRTMRDLVALSTLPAIWTGLGQEGIAASLADVLLHTLPLDLIYIRLAGPSGAGLIEVVRGKRHPEAGQDEAVKAALAPLLESDRTEPPATIPDPFGGGTLHVAITRFGISDDYGVLIAASRNDDFPTEQDRLLLGVGANQTAIVVQRRRAEERVQEQREWLRVTLASIGDAVIATDTAGRVTFLNSVAQELTGWTLADAQGKPLEAVFAILNEQTRQPVDNPVERVLREGGIVGLGNHTILIARDGRERPIDDSAAPIRDAVGKMLGVVLIFRDVTEQRRAESALRESEQRFRQLADAMPQIVWTARPDGNIDYLNRRWTEFTGLPQTVGNDAWGQILHPDDARPANERWAASLATGAPFEMEMRLLDRRQQSYRWHLIRTVAVHDGAGTVARWFGTSTDIHEQKRAEESSRFLAEASAELAGVVDYESTLQKVANLAVPYFADWSAVDLADDDGNLRRLAVAHQDPNKIALVRELMRDYPPRPAVAGRGLRRPPHGQAGDRRRDHRRHARAGRPGRTPPAPGSFAGPEVLHLRAAGRLRQLARRPHVRHRRVGPQVHRSRSRPGDGPGAPGGGCHREYPALPGAAGNRPPQGRVPGDVGPRAAQPAGPDPQCAANPQDAEGRCGNGRAVTGDDGAAGASSVRLVDDLLDVSRVMRGKIELRKERVELAAVVARAVETVQPLVDAQGHQLSVRMPADSLLLEADPVRLAQVVGNLLTNAAKYTEPNGRIWLTAERDGEMAVLRVRDNGIGIAPHMLPRIFELFVQADHASTKAQGGLGIGLTLVKNLVEMHNGIVQARSDGLGQGCEFVVRLPARGPGD